MTRTLIVTLLLGAAIAAGTIGIATSGEPEAVGPPRPDGPEATQPAPPNPELLSPMHREIHEFLETERHQVEELSRRLATVLAEERLALHLEIEQVKKSGQRGVFEIQLRYAREAGRAEAVRDLEAVIERLDRPEPAGTGETLLQQYQRGQLPTAVRSN